MGMDVVGIIGVSIAAATGVSGVVLYVVRAENGKTTARLDGRINTHEAGCEQRQKRIDSRLESIDHKTDRIDEKLDRLVEAR